MQNPALCNAVAEPGGEDDWKKCPWSEETDPLPQNILNSSPILQDGIGKQISFCLYIWENYFWGGHAPPSPSKFRHSFNAPEIEESEEKIWEQLYSHMYLIVRGWGSRIRQNLQKTGEYADKLTHKL